MVIFGEKLLLLGIHYHFKLASVHHVKFTQKILAGVSPPPPSWQCQDFESFWCGNSSLTILKFKLMFPQTLNLLLAVFLHALPESFLH